METTVLAWLQRELEVYSKLLLISPVRDLSPEYWQGKPLLCLAHHYFPHAIPTLLPLLQNTSTQFCYQLFHDLLDVHQQDNWLHYLHDIYTAIDLKKQDTTLRELHIGDITSVDTQQQHVIEQYASNLLPPLEALFHQLVQIALREEEGLSSRSPSPRITVIESQPSPPRTREESVHLFSRQEIETCLISIESNGLLAFQKAMDALPLSIQHHPDVAVSISAIQATQAAIQLQLQKHDLLSTTLQFSNMTSSIRNELEFIQAKMLKTTTTDTGIQDLETRTKSTGIALDQLHLKFQTFLSSDTPSHEEYTYLVKKYQSICYWVDEVRVWFVEAERIRTWIEERIHILENKPNLNALEEVELEYEMMTVQDFNQEQADLEKQVELFDTQDMTRLRDHVKALTGGNKDLSPADTTTIEITFTTLMTLDRLMHLLRRHSYELQILTLRMVWEKEYSTSVSWVRTTSEQVKHFVREKARWKSTENTMERNEMINTLIEFEKQSSAFDLGQFTTTVNKYQDLDDACNIELPTHLESRQVALEESFEELTHRIGFARQVVEQYLVVTDFLNRADTLKAEGDDLRQEITMATEQHGKDHMINTHDFSEKVSTFQENALRLVTGVAARIPYPEANHPTDQQGNEDANEAIRMVIGARKSTLVLFGEALDQSLSAYRRALQLQKRAKQLQDEMMRLQSWVDERLRSIKKSKVDVFVGKCALDDTDLARLKKERDGQVSKMNGIKENEIKRLQENISALASLSAQPPTNPNTVSLVTDLNQGMDELTHQLVVLGDALQVHSLCLDILAKRISWETRHAKSFAWISDATFQVWEFVGRKAQWRSDYEQATDRALIQTEFEAMENKVTAFNEQQLAFVDETFTDLVHGFTVITNTPGSCCIDEQTQDNITPEHVQRRQDTLVQSYNNLCDLIVYTKQVLSQYTALESFSAKVKSLDGVGKALLLDIQSANENIMQLNQVNDLQQSFTSQVQTFGHNVVELWMQHGSQLPYPQCPEDARATRPTTNDDEISTEVATVVYKAYVELQELVKRMGELLQGFDTSIAYRTELEQWCTQTKQFNTSVQDLLYQIEHGYTFDVKTGTVVIQDSSTENDMEKAKAWILQRDQLTSEHYNPLLAQLQTLEQAIKQDDKVHYVDTLVTETPLAQLEVSWRAYNHAITLFDTQSTVCYNIRQWQSLYNEQWTWIHLLQDKVREWNNEKNVYLSTSPTEALVLSTLVHHLQQADTDLKEREQASFPRLRTFFKNVVVSLNTLESQEDMTEHVASLQTKQEDLEKLVHKLQDMITSQLTETQLLKARHAWEVAVDTELKLCTELNGEIESFIRSQARWSTSQEAISPTPFADIRLQTLSDLLETLASLQTQQPTFLLQIEVVSKKKQSIITAIEKIKQHMDFVDQVLEQRASIVAHLDKVSQLESLAESIKTRFLSTDAIHGDEQGELQTYDAGIAAWIPRLDLLPVRHYGDHDPSCRQEDVAHNAVMTDMLTARKLRLDELSTSLHAILNAKEHLSRCKAAEDTYMAEVHVVQAWIIAKLTLLQEMHPADTVEELRVAVTAMGAIQSASDTYTGTVQGLKESAAQCISLIQQQGDDHAILTRIQETQAAVDASWDHLLETIQETKTRYTTSMHHAEYVQCVDAFHTQCALFESSVLDVDLANMTEDTTHQWQQAIHTLEHDHVEPIRSRLSEEKAKMDVDQGVSPLLLKNMSDTFTRVLDVFDAFKTLVKEKTTTANHFRFKAEYLAGADQLDLCMNETRVALTRMKSSECTIRGVSVKEDMASVQHRVDMYTTLCQTWEQHHEKYDEQRSFYRFLQLNHVSDLAVVDARQADLEQQWKQLKMDVVHDKRYVDQVSKWFDLHTKLNDIQSTTLQEIRQRLDTMVLEEGILPLFLEKDATELQLLTTKLASYWDDVASEQEQDENKIRFTTHYEQVQQETNDLTLLLNEKKRTAVDYVDFISCQKQIQDMNEHMDQVVDVIEQRLNDLKLEDESSKGIEPVFRICSAGVVTSELLQKKITSQITGTLEPLLASLQSKHAHEDRYTDFTRQLNENKARLSFAVNKEQTMHDMARRVLGHAKSAEDISAWIDNCNTAISQVLYDHLDEGEAFIKIESLKQKLVDFEPVVQSFHDMSGGLSKVSQDTPIAKQLVHIGENNTAMIEKKWTETNAQLETVESTVQKTARGVAVARKFKVIMALVGETREYVTSIKLFDLEEDNHSVHTQDAMSPMDLQSPITDENLGDESDDDKTRIGNLSEELKTKKDMPQQPLLSMLRQAEVEIAKHNLGSVETDIKPQLENELHQLNNMIDEFKDIDSTFIRQHQEVKESVESLYKALEDKHVELEKAMEIGTYLTVADDFDILQSSLEEVISKLSSHHTLVGGGLSRTDLHAKLIELDARFKYYERKIVQTLDTAKEKALVVTEKKRDESALVSGHLQGMEEKWISIKKQFKTRKIELSRSIDTSLDPDDRNARLRKSSLPTRKASSLLRDRADSSASRQKLSPTLSSITTTSSTSSKSGSTNRLQANRSTTNRYLGSNMQHQPSKSATYSKSKPARLVPAKAPLNSYVADPHNDLDIEIGRIVNETPYRVKVKMVPGEVGRYWFGNANPKLAYCRVLKSKMVMVRVGGGWTELSQFLRDHALLEGDFIPRSRRTTNNLSKMIPEEEEPKSPTIQEGFIETRRDFNQQRQHRHISTSPKIQPQPNRSSTTTNSSRSNTSFPTGSPSHSASTNNTSGYKDGDRFIALDQHGNQHEVQMRKVDDIGHTNKSTSTASSNDYTRRRIARKKEKNNVKPPVIPDATK